MKFNKPWINETEGNLQKLSLMSLPTSDRKIKPKEEKLLLLFPFCSKLLRAI